ncbi:hypothetical protein L7F22_053718 [Adiantum nelumboides]|nr:hypothetical protein [Adiantum nelumboides]
MEKASITLVSQSFKLFPSEVKAASGRGRRFWASVPTSCKEDSRPSDEGGCYTSGPPWARTTRQATGEKACPGHLDKQRMQKEEGQRERGLVGRANWGVPRGGGFGQREGNEHRGSL